MELEALQAKKPSHLGHLEVCSTVINHFCHSLGCYYILRQLREYVQLYVRIHIVPSMNTFQDAMELDLGKAEVAHKTSDSMKEQLEAQVNMIIL